jgi:DNA-binding GntR family transcriptional regulator
VPTEKPKYTLIADHLLREIQQGQLPVGGLIPTESQLMRAFGVSRNTVRTAVQHLKQRGILASRQGQGSKVISSQRQGAFIETIQSIDELVKFGQETQRVLIARRSIDADADLARKFNCAIGRRFAEALMLRKTISSAPRTIALVTLWMDVLIEPVIDGLATIRKSAAEIIANEYGYKPMSVTQTVEAGLLDDADAETLAVPLGSPSLIIERCYRAEIDGEPYLVARSVCRSDAIKVVSTFVNQR